MLLVVATPLQIQNYGLDFYGCRAVSGSPTIRCGALDIIKYLSPCSRIGARVHVQVKMKNARKDVAPDTGIQLMSILGPNYAASSGYIIID